MQISDFSVKKYKSSLIFCRFLKKRFRVVLFSRDGLVTPNMHMFFGLTNKFVINLKWRKRKKLFQAINKGKFKNLKFNQFLNYCTHNENEIKWISKIRMKAKGTSSIWNMKNNVLARHFHNSTFLERVSWRVSWRIPNHSHFMNSIFWTCYIDFGTYLFIFFPIFQ